MAAKVVFYALEKEGKKTYTGDALTGADGAFTISTYQANDGAPVGEYAVTVVQREPMSDAAGNPGPNRLPAKYATAQSSPLRAQVKTGANDFALDLSK